MAAAPHSHPGSQKQLSTLEPITTLQLVGDDAKTNNMKLLFAALVMSTVLLSCGSDKDMKMLQRSMNPMIGSWKLITATTVENGDTSITDYTGNISFIKIINETHFAFLQHDINKGRDSSAVFVAGGGKYSFERRLYTEHLEYCSARDWEGNDFSFTISLLGDTLIQKGVEKVPISGVDRVNIEKYIKVKD
jgi:hypothetical protein